MAVIEKKTWPELFEKIKRGEKNVEVRLADFDLKHGDILVLKEWDQLRQRYTGRSMSKVVKQLHKIDITKFWDIEKIKKHGIYVIEI